MTDAHHTVLGNARLLSPEGGVSELRDIVVANDRIESITPAGTADTTGRERVDLHGRYVIPGLWDHHVHIGQLAAAARRFDVAAARSAREVADAVHARLETHPPERGAPLIGYGFRDALWADRPDFQLLDEAAPSTPVVLVSADLHCCWLNSPALALVGAEGHRDGVLREAESLAAKHLIAEHDVLDLEREIGTICDGAARRGLAGIIEFERDRNLSLWGRRVAGGVRQLRVACNVWPENLDEVLGLGLASGDVVEGTDGLVSQGSLKILIDGSLGTRTALCYEPYAGTPDRPAGTGTLTTPPDEVVELMGRATEHRVSAAVHAIGDHAATIALDGFAATGATGTLEHAQLLTDADFDRLARLGVVASVQPAHLVDDRDVADEFWGDRADRAYAYRTMLSRGAGLVFGSDAPVAPLDPWHTMAAAAFRTYRSEAPWHPEQRLSIDEALWCSTREARGLRAGDAGDLAVLDADPREAQSAGELAGTSVAGTMVAGEWTWRSLD